MKHIKLAIILIIRTIRWIFIKFSTKNNEIIAEVNDYNLILKTDKKGLDLKEDSIFRQLALDGRRELEATKIIKQVIKPGDIICELGANIGYYAVLEAGIAGPEGIVYAIELEPHNIELLKRNIALNNLKNIQAYHLAISDKNGEYPLYVTGSSNLHSMIKPSHGYFSTINTKTSTLDNFLADKKKITFLRMDIEGYEYYALRGMQKTLNENPKLKLFIELHAHLIEPEKTIEILQMLKSHGFEILKAITHDNYLRRILKQVTVEDISIDELCHDKRVVNRQNAFEIFFSKQNVQ